MSVRFPLRWLIWLTAALSCAAPASALTPQQARALVAGETETRIAALNELLVGADEKTVGADPGAVRRRGEVQRDTRSIVMKDGKGYDPVTGAELAVPDGAEDVVNNNQMRGELDAALASIKLLRAGRHACAPRPSRRCRPSPTKPSCR